MREIKFRAWDLERKQMRGVMDIKWFDNGAMRANATESQDFYEPRLNSKNVTEFVLMQYTGLKDRNGKEIYEGDIVQFPDPCTRSQSGYELSTGVIEWHTDEAKFDVTGRESVDLETFWEDIDMAEVIGNIYENPDLLEANT